MAQVQDYSPKNPLRDLDWRWGRAGVVVEGGWPLSRKRDDSWVYRTTRFRLRLETCVTDYDYQSLSFEFPDQYWAYRLRESRDNPESRANVHALEARVLADQDVNGIAAALTASAGVVEAYERMFFDARPKLASRDYVLFKVLGAAVGRGIRERDYDLLWKLFALYGGVHVLDLLISTFQNPAVPQNRDEVGAFVKDSINADLARKAMIGAKTIQLDRDTTTILIDLYLKSAEIENEKGSGGARSQIMDNIAGMVNALPFVVGPPKAIEGPRGRPTTADYDLSSVELTAAEVLTLSSGGSIEGGEALLDETFPPPPRRDLAATS